MSPAPEVRQREEPNALFVSGSGITIIGFNLLVCLPGMYLIGRVMPDLARHGHPIWSRIVIFELISLAIMTAGLVLLRRSSRR